VRQFAPLHREHVPAVNTKVYMQLVHIVVDEHVLHPCGHCTQILPCAICRGKHKVHI
jgi:hypothetical protein